MANPTTPEQPSSASNQPIATMTAGESEPTCDATCHEHQVQFIFYCAPLDGNPHQILNPMYAAVYHQDMSRYGVTDSASYLNHLPYVVVDADTREVIRPSPTSHEKYATFPRRVENHHNVSLDGTRSVHTFSQISIKREVKRIALHIGNDAFPDRRKFQLFPLELPTDATRCIVHVYELRSDLKKEFSDRNHLGDIPSHNILAKYPHRPGEYYGYLDGDLWRQISYEFTDGDTQKLCPPETLQRTWLTDHAPASGLDDCQDQSLINSSPTAPIAPTTPPWVNLDSIMAKPKPLVDDIYPPQKPFEKLDINWVRALAPIYEEGSKRLRSTAPFTAFIEVLGITLTFNRNCMANAIYTSNETTTLQALRRTSPRAFAVILKAAWMLHIDKLTIGSTWRPMLGSRLHKMGDALDVVHFDDDAENTHMDVNNNGTIVHQHPYVHEDHPFPSTQAGRKLRALYDALNYDKEEVLHGGVYTPWMNWVFPHDTHMHITVLDGENE